ncbi:hypothetical protein Tco_0779841 [Tanacetum coccineum]
MAPCLSSREKTKFENAFNSEFEERMRKYTRYNAQSFNDAMICTMDSIRKYMLEIILHQQRTLHLLKQKTLMQTQEDHSHQTQAVNTDSLKVDLVVKQNSCSEKEDSNSETASSKSPKECIHLNSETQYSSFVKETQKALVSNMDQNRKSCLFFGQDVMSTFHKNNAPQRRANYKINLTKMNFKKSGSSQPSVNRGSTLQRYTTPTPGMLKSPFLKNTSSKISMKRGVNKDRFADARKSGNDTDADDADIRPIYAEEPMAEEIDVLEIMNIELEHSGAKLRKENETLKQHYKDLFDYIKITRSKTTEQTTSLLANNAELKAQIQEKVFAIAALKNDLWKLKGNSVDTKFDKTSVLGKPVLPSIRNQSVVRQPNAFKSERTQMLKQRFASQVDVNKNLSKPVTQHYLPKKTESAFAKPDHMIASSSSRNSSKNMPRFSSNDMVHNHYLDVAKKKIQERDRNSTTSVTTSARIQTTADDSKPKPRSNNQTSRSLPVSKSSRVTITVVPKADHSKSSSSFLDSKNFVCSTCHKCVFNANHDACNNKNPEGSKPRAKISIPKDHKQWIPTRKLFDSCTSKVDSEPPHGLNIDILNIHECKQPLDLRSTRYFNGEKSSCLKSFAVTTTDASNKRQQQPDSTSSTSTLATTVTADGNFDL